MSVTVRLVNAEQARELAPELAGVLMDCVEGGASVSFLAPLERAKAEAYWLGVADGVASGERMLLVAEDAAERVVGTVQILLRQPENQPHRADVSKMLVHRSARRQGIGEKLMRMAEDAALLARKTVLVLDTASGEAERLYERLDWVRVGVVPGFALLPNGEPCDTCFFYKSLL